MQISYTFASQFEKRRLLNGAIAQLVEQRTENPCVPGSIPGGTTSNGLIAQLVQSICLTSRGS